MDHADSVKDAAKHLMMYISTTTKNYLPEFLVCSLVLKSSKTTLQSAYYGQTTISISQTDKESCTLSDKKLSTQTEWQKCSETD